MYFVIAMSFLIYSLHHFDVIVEWEKWKEKLKVIFYPHVEYHLHHERAATRSHDITLDHIQLLSFFFRLVVFFVVFPFSKCLISRGRRRKSQAQNYQRCSKHSNQTRNSYATAPSQFTRYILHPFSARKQEPEVTECFIGRFQ